MMLRDFRLQDDVATNLIELPVSSLGAKDARQVSAE
jgi:hypothetical protein